MPLRQTQSSLDSFLGLPSKKKTKQTTISQMFSRQKENKKTDESKDEDQQVSPQVKSDIDADKEESSPVKRTVPSKEDRKKSLAKRRRVIEDSDEDEDMPQAKATQPEPSQTEKEKQKSRKYVQDDDGDEEEEEEEEETQGSKKEDGHYSSSNCQRSKKEDEDFEPPVDDEMDSVHEEEEEDLQDEEIGTESESLSEDLEDNEQETTKATKKRTPVAKQSSTKPVGKRNKNTKNAAVSKKAGSAKMGEATMTDQELLAKTEQWPKTNGGMPYSVLCQAFDDIEAITGRLQIQDIMTRIFRAVLLLKDTTAKDHSLLLDILYLASNSVAPAYECVELGIGDSILVKAIAEAYGTNKNTVEQNYKKEGDLGTVAMVSKSKQRTLSGMFGMAAAKPLTPHEVLTVFREIATTTGSKSQKYKVDKIKKLLVKAQGNEPKYIIRGLQGKLRIGLAQSTVLISLAHAVTLTVPPQVAEQTTKSKSSKDESTYPEEARQYSNLKTPKEKRLEAAVAIIKKAYCNVPSFDALAKALLTVPLQEIHMHCTLTPGIPVEPMLAKPTKSIQEVLKRLNGLLFTCEYKYDGERAQVHRMPDGTTKVFSRNLLDTSEKFPEVPQFVKEASKTNVESYVLDAEVVAFNNKTGQLVPFQVLSTRKKTEASAETAKVQIIVQAFDLMYLNGRSLLNVPLIERRKLLFEHFQPVEGKFQFAKSLDHTENGDTAVLEEFLEAAVKGQCEGLMVKTLEVDAVYEPSRRSLNWLKLKKDYLQGLGDSVDLVPIGAYYGRGKRTGVYGAYLLACYDTDTEEFQSVCKIGTGFSDEDLKTLAAGLNEHKIPEKTSQYNVSDQLECDVWFDAVQVWEVKAADLSKSSAHRGAEGKTGEPGRGIGLRFPRFERMREDKKPEDATTSDQILEMYFQQDSIVAGGEGMGDEGI